MARHGQTAQGASTIAGMSLLRFRCDSNDRERASQQPPIAYRLPRPARCQRDSATQGGTVTRRRNAQHLNVWLLGKPRWETDLGGGELEGWRALLIALIALEPAPTASAVAGHLWPGAPSLVKAF